MGFALEEEPKNSLVFWELVLQMKRLSLGLTQMFFATRATVNLSLQIGIHFVSPDSSANALSFYDCEAAYSQLKRIKSKIPKLRAKIMCKALSSTTNRVEATLITSELVILASALYSHGLLKSTV